MPIHQELTDEFNDELSKIAGLRQTKFFEKIKDDSDMVEAFIMYHSEAGMFLERFSRYYIAVGFAHFVNNIKGVLPEKRGENFSKIIAAKSEPNIRDIIQAQAQVVNELMSEGVEEPKEEVKEETQ